MSRVGKQPITIPPKTDVSVDGSVVSVKGPLGTLSRTLAREVSVTVLGGEVAVEPTEETIRSRALWGTFASHIRNMVAGVNEQFVKKLIIEGVGFRAESAGTTLSLSVGFSHPVKVVIPEGIDVSIEKSAITIKGIDKEAVGQFAARVRAVKKPEPYKGKGIRYETEVVRRKQGKRAAT